MVLATYVNNTLDQLLDQHKNGMNRLKGFAENDLERESLDGNKKTYSEIIGAMKEVSQQFGGRLDPKVNEDLEHIIEYFISSALKDNENPSQLYKIILDAYNQEIFSKGDEALLRLLSKIYWENLKILGRPDPKTGQYYRNVSREARENAAKTLKIIGELLGEALYRHWLSRGKKVTKGEVMAKLAKHASSFYGVWEGVKGKIASNIEELTPNEEVQDAVERLVTELENSYLSFIQGLIVAAYNKRPAPEHIIPVLKYLSGKGFFKNVFSEIYNEIGSYINQLQPQIAQYLQLNQPAGQQQGQQINQPNIQQPAPIQQNQQQPAQQANQPQQNQQNNQ
jgi:hypothetical protein